MNAREILGQNKVMPVVVVDSVENGLKMAESLLKGGVNAMEITLRTPCALEAVKEICAAFPHMCVGVGTVLNARQFEVACERGAKFVISPGLNGELLRLNSPVPFVPGVASASEVLMALEHGLDTLKLFPAVAVGGVALLKAFASVFEGVKFCPTGGVSTANAREFLNLPNVICVGGSWITSELALVEERAKESTKL